MIPRILEYQDGKIFITAEAYLIPELKVIIDKYKNNAEPYLAYIHLLTALDSPYINIPVLEREETVLYDIINTQGEFDTNEPLLQPAIEKLAKLYLSPVRSFFEELKEELHRWREFLKNNSLQQGKEGNLSERLRILQNVGSILMNYKKAEEQADEELKAATRGDQEVGEY